MVETKHSYRQRSRYKGKTNIVTEVRDKVVGKFEPKITLEHRRSTRGDDIREFEFAKRSNQILFRPHSAKREIIEIVPWSYQQELVLGKPDSVQTFLDAQITNANLLELYNPRDDLATWSHKYDLGELKTLAYAEANERELDVLTALAEMPETIKMFAEMGKALIKPRQTALAFFKEYQKAARKGKVELGSKAMDHLSSAWLQYRYGIMPVYYLCEALKEQLNRDLKVFQASRKKDVVKLESGIQKKLSLPNLWNSPSYMQAHYSIEGEHKFEFLLRRIYTLQQLNSKRFGYSIPATMWELTTLSFVVDWFIQVGDLITALTPTCADAEASAAITRVQYTITSELTGYLPRQGETLKGDTGVFSRIILDSYTREVGSGTPQFSIPVGLQMNLKRVLDGFALSWPKIRQALTKR